MRIKPSLPFIGTAAFALIAGLVAGYLNLSHRVPVARPSVKTTVVLLNPPRRFPAFTLQTADGGTLTHRDLTAHWSLVYFGYTHGGQDCLKTLSDLAEMKLWLAGLPPRYRPAIYFISVDPGRDTASVLRQYIAQFRTGMTAATGSPNQLTLLTNALNAQFSYDPPDRTAGYVIRHSANITVIDPQGRQVAVFAPPLNPEQMADNYRFILNLNKATP